MGMFKSKPSRPAPPAPAPAAEPQGPSREEWGKIIFQFKHNRDKFVANVDFYTKQMDVRCLLANNTCRSLPTPRRPPLPPLHPHPPAPSQTLRARYHEALAAKNQGAAGRIARQVADALKLVEMNRAGEDKAREYLGAMERRQIANDMYHSSKQVAALLNEMNKAITPEMIEEAEVDRLAAMQRVDEVCQAVMGGAQVKETTAEDVDAFLRAHGFGGEEEGAAVIPTVLPVPALQYAGGGAAAVAQQPAARQSARVAAQRQAVEA
jgi:hypothetical protein